MAQVAATRFDAIFLDIRMPDGSGLQLLNQLRNFHASNCQAPVPVIAYTALAFEQDRIQFLAAGCEGFLAKPVQAEELFGTLENLLNVTFAREWENVSSSNVSADYARLTLPANLHERLLTAAELHSTTVLKMAVEELQHLGGDARTLAEKIRQHMRAYEMDAIARVLMQVSIAPATQKLENITTSEIDQESRNAVT
jgi:CheY-like chemotaxis protein